jgi:hypothetical protein
LAGFFDACFAFAGFGIGGAARMRRMASSNFIPSVPFIRKSMAFDINQFVPPVTGRAIISPVLSIAVFEL